MTDGPFDFIQVLRPFLPQKGEIAVGVSGGPDSMALGHMLAHGAGIPVHILTVDHALRPEAAQEAKQVAEWVSGWPQVRHAILTRDIQGKPASKIQEDARTDRYALLAGYCAEHGIDRLFIAHHQDDQAETFLFRLAKGSGLDGLGAMRAGHDYNDDLKIIRPFLDVPKSELVGYCKEHDLPFVEDPSNEDERFARIRLRHSRNVLEREGLTAKRLSVTAARLARARAALDFYTEQTWKRALSGQKQEAIIFSFEKLREAPEEVRLRVLLRAVDTLQDDPDYGPRMERMEDLAARIFCETDFKGATLAGCKFALDRKRGELTISLE